MREAVVGIDGSRHSFNALDFLTTLISPEEWRIVLVSIIDEAVVQAASGAGVSLAENMRRKTESMLIDLQKKLLEKGFKAEWVIRLGKPQEELVRLSEKRNAELIVVGSRGLRGLKKLILGSVSSYVVSNSKIPVLVVPMRG